MKSRSIRFFVILPVAILAGWAAIAYSAEPDPAGDSEADQQLAIETRLDDEKARIHTRLGMSSLLEVDSSADPNYIADKIANGTIIEATLEEVEAAVEAAALTPEKEDDIEATILRHRGSYRYYLPE